MTRSILPAALIPVLLGVPAFGQAAFRGLGDLPAGAFYSEGRAVSADGSVAVGTSVTAGGGPFGQVLTAYRWTAGTGMQAVYDGSGASTTAASISADGATIAGWVEFGAFSPLGTQAFLWTAASGRVLLGDLPGGVNQVPRSFGRAISADGSMIVGTGQSDRGDDAFRVDVGTLEMNNIGSLLVDPYGSYATAVSADGGVIVGGSLSAPGELQAFRWTPKTEMVALGFLPTPVGVTRYSQAEGVSADGSVIVGSSRSTNSPNGNEAFRWTVSGMQPLGDLAGGLFQSWAYAITPDGSVIVGRASIEAPPGPFGGGSQPRAFIWDAATGMRDLQQVLADLGANVAGWSLQEARAVTRTQEGLVIVGTGVNPQSSVEGWIALIPGPAPCYPNCDGSAGVPVLNVNDFICFSQRFAAGDPYANCDLSTAPPVLNVLDFVCFQSSFAAGCR